MSGNHWIQPLVITNFTGESSISAANALRWITDARVLIGHLAASAERGLPTQQGGIDEMYSRLEVVCAVLAHLTRNLDSWLTPGPSQSDSEPIGLVGDIVRELCGLGQGIDRLVAALDPPSGMLN